jgi:hypothetical protein
LFPIFADVSRTRNGGEAWPFVPSEAGQRFGPAPHLGRNVMTNRTLIAGITAFAVASAFGPAVQAKSMSAASFMKAVNTNADKTISKDELDAYAKKRFAALETDNDKTLNDKELKGRLSAAGMTMADTDKDKTVDEAEFVAYAETLFDAANAKGDKTLSVKELETPAGKKLMTLLK